MDIITCLIYLFPEDTDGVHQANFIIFASQKSQYCSNFSNTVQTLYKHKDKK